MRYILDLGPTVMLPIVIIIFSKLLGMKLGVPACPVQAFSAL
jgi:PTS system galactitol-specific IIC component